MTKLSLIFRTFSILFLIGLLANCGFHLRGSIPLPPQLETIYIQSDRPFGEFEQVLRQTLRTYKVNLATDVKQAPITLNIISAQLNQTAGAVSGNASMRQYTLNYIVTYNVLAKNGTIIIPTATVSSNTTFTSDMNKMMTSSSNTTAQYLPSLQRDAVSRMIDRLTSENSHTALQHYFQTSVPIQHENKTRTA